MLKQPKTHNEKQKVHLFAKLHILQVLLVQQTVCIKELFISVCGHGKLWRMLIQTFRLE